MNLALLYLLNIPVWGAFFSYYYLVASLKKRKMPASWLGGIDSFRNYKLMYQAIKEEVDAKARARLKTILNLHWICLAIMILAFISLIVVDSDGRRVVGPG